MSFWLLFLLLEVVFALIASLVILAKLGSTPRAFILLGAIWGASILTLVVVRLVMSDADAITIF